MAYRLEKHEKPKKDSRLVSDSTPATWYVRNGAKARFAIPCWYIEVQPPIPAHYHNRPLHDHIGWPSPNHPDHCCQSWDFAHSCCSFDSNKHHCDRCSRYVDMGLVIPVKLKSEGYSDIDVSLSENIPGLTVSAKIDDREEWVILVDISTMVPSAKDKRVEVGYSIFANGRIAGMDVRDIVASGKIMVLPGPYE